MHIPDHPRAGRRSQATASDSSDFTIDSATAAMVEASWNRCQEQYGLNPASRLLGNRYSHSELAHRLERVEEPLKRADALISEIRKVVKNADYTLLIADSEGAAIAEYCDSAASRELRQRGITVGTLWDEPCVGTNGIGTALASDGAVTINGDQHFHTTFRQFICSAAPLRDHCGTQYGVINVTGNATRSHTEAIRVGQYVRRCANSLHTHVFREYFQHHAMVALTDSLFSEEFELSRLMAIDEDGCVVGATNGLLSSLDNTTRQALVGMNIDELLGLDYEALFAGDGRLHRLDAMACGERYALSIAPRRQPFKRTKSRAAPARQPSQHVLGLDELAGTDRRSQKLINVARRMIGNSTSGEEIPILLQGETGTGKDTFARALHLESRRADKPFVELNCAAIPHSLIDSELFGYAPGTFTGGLKEGKSGHIVAANGGTLFLDEIGDMPTESQTRLLRVLAERQVQPLGAAQSVRVDFQLICASHRDLSTLVAEGSFRQDLYYRVCGAKLLLPPLRQRQDLMNIVDRLMRRFDPDHQVSLSEAVIERLSACQWPGNIRQLHNVIQFLVFSCISGRATLEDLPDDLDETVVSGGSVSTTTTPTNPQQAPVYRSAQEELVDALYRTRWCVSRTARDLGVSRATVHRHIKKYGIVRPDHK